MRAADIGDYRGLARRRLPHFLFEYIDGGANNEITLARNVADLQAVALRQRVLRDMSSISLETELLGRTQRLPVALGPIGLAGLTARRGERQAYRAAAAKGVPFTLSTVSLCALDEVAGAADGDLWFQLYMVRDRGFMVDLLAKATALGCSTLMFTVDMPLPGTRYRDRRSGLSGASGLQASLRRFGQAARRPDWAWDVGLRGRPHQLGNVAPLLGANSGLEDFLAWMSANFDPAASWKDLAFIRQHWKGPIVLKGVLDPDDARQAAAEGLDAIVVSNHGGRQLDGVPSTAQALPWIAEAVGDRVPVLADGGVRSGLDVVRLLALGAKGVMLGRAWAYALGAAGEAGVAHMLSLIEAEMRVAMTLTGAARVADIDGSILVRPGA